MEAFTLLDAVAAPLPRINVDTDQIVPALYLQKPRSADFGAFLFRDVRHDAQGLRRPDFPINDAAYADARILVAGRNFGCGSSREHAVWALADGGFRAVIAPSFGDIFFSNALKNGLLPVRLAEPLVDRLLDTLQRFPGTRLCIDLAAQTVTVPDASTARFEIDAFARHCLLEGLDELDYTLRQSARIEAYERERAGLSLP
ncbi:3-isopropylmalate dehydratase small subunit [Variovorax sp. JS1663]|uniref:3-isopropylmalate dehydratase small subunit n=1 Tax=Variovorax sp. JS1663 TaxID=1851577 RepID=UPI000B349A26|nr:3-isopropylmalate dehydratase small subunit [Variovorax sp. JS1663]OUM00862.1 3-isopropylmalate dehydratase small subunit [Variovorax sp. JS1663]